MLYEYESKTLSAIKEIVKKVIDIASNNGVDDIDLSKFDSTADQLASEVFTIVGTNYPIKEIALKEAYDYVLAHKRIIDVNSKDRAFYYEHAAEEYQNTIDYADYYKSVALKGLELVKNA